MVTETYNLSKEEILIYSLGNLYKNHGYKKYSMAKFEPYDMYLEHRNFLSKSGILTFTDATGRLMALRPDVTMSIAKNARPEIKEEKYYSALGSSTVVFSSTAVLALARLLLVLVVFLVSLAVV